MDYKSLYEQRKANARVLNKEEAQEYINHYGSVVTIGNMDEQVVFFTNEHCYGLYRKEGKLPSGWVPCTMTMPHRVKPRPICPDGIVSDVDTLLAIFHSEDTLLTSDEMLTAWLAEH